MGCDAIASMRRGMYLAGRGRCCCGSVYFATPDARSLSSLGCVAAARPHLRRQPSPSKDDQREQISRWRLVRSRLRCLGPTQSVLMSF